MIESVVVTHQGKARELNEDTVLESSNLGLWLVADGIGGSGDVASQLAVQTIEREMRLGRRLLEALEIADQKIREAAAKKLELASMASTVVACHIEDNHYAISWVGDSRAYIRDEDGEFSLLSTDHNCANQINCTNQAEDLDGQSKVPSESAAGEQYELAQALGNLSLNHLPKIVGDLHHGELLMLCSDGLSDVLEEQGMAQILDSQADLPELSQALLDAAIEAGAPDNISLALIRYREEGEVLKASDFNYRSPLDKTKYTDHTQSRPLFLLLVLLSILIILAVL